MAKTRRCPFTDCATMVIPELFCCRKHWSMVPKYLRDEVYRIYFQWCKGTIDGVELQKRQDEIILLVERGR